MEAGGWAAAAGGHVLGAAQEPREQDEGKEAGAAAERKKGAGGGGGMKFRVRARAPHGVGALLLIGGAAVVGAAVLAWRRRSRHGNKGGAVDRPDERRMPAKKEALDGGVVEDGKVQGGSFAQKLDQSDEKFSAGNIDIGIGSGCLDGNMSEGNHQIHKDDEITTDRLESKHEERIDENSVSNPDEVHTHDLESKHEEKIDENSSGNPVEVHTHDLESKHEVKVDENSGGSPVEVHTHDLESQHEEKIDEDSGSHPVEFHAHDLNKEHVEKVDQKSSSNHVEITAHDMCQDNEHAEKIDHVEGIDHYSGRNPVEIFMQEMVTVCLVSGSVEKVEKDSSKDIEEEIAKKDNRDIEAPDQSKFCIKGPGIILSKHNDESDGIQEAESMENTPTALLMMHQDQLLDDMATDTVTETEDAVTETEDTVTETEESVKETEEAKGERTVTEESDLEQDEKNDLVGLAELASSPALSSLVKPIEKTEPEFPRPNETGMKIEQDYTNGELREHTDLISKGGAMQGGGDMATMDCRSSALFVIALIFALAMGITIIVRLYAPSRATKLQMDLP